MLHTGKTTLVLGLINMPRHNLGRENKPPKVSIDVREPIFLFSRALGEVGIWESPQPFNTAPGKEQRCGHSVNSGVFASTMLSSLTSVVVSAHHAAHAVRDRHSCEMCIDIYLDGN